MCSRLNSRPSLLLIPGRWFGESSHKYARGLHKSPDGVSKNKVQRLTLRVFSQKLPKSKQRLMLGAMLREGEVDRQRGVKAVCEVSSNV